MNWISSPIIKYLHLLHFYYHRNYIVRIKSIHKVDAKTRENVFPLEVDSLHRPRCSLDSVLFTNSENINLWLDFNI